MPPCSAARYSDERDRPDLASTSELSVDLHFGTLSPRRAAVALRDVPGGAAIVRQLAWRDWYAHLLWEHPRLTRHPMRPAYEALQWQNDNEEFEAWCAGTTGYPIVDAGMRQLAATGWMHNRVRMIVASFLVKDLLVDWRWGEAHFRRLLVDGDTTQNVGNWQWVAGTGPDAAPYFRIFNPTTQAKSSTPTVTSCAVGYRNSSTSRAPGSTSRGPHPTGCLPKRASSWALTILARSSTMAMLDSARWPCISTPVNEGKDRYRRDDDRRTSTPHPPCR